MEEKLKSKNNVLKNTSFDKGINKVDKKNKILKFVLRSVAGIFSFLAVSSCVMNAESKAMQTKLIKYYKTLPQYAQELEEFEQANLQNLNSGLISSEQYIKVQNDFSQEENILKLIKQSDDNVAKNRLLEIESKKQASAIGTAGALTLAIISVAGAVCVEKKKSDKEDCEDLQLEIAENF